MFKDNNVEEGYPRPISDFGLPPGGVDAAFSWAHNDKTYFFKDQLYWRYDEHTRRMDPGHPAQSPPWRGVPSTLDAAMRWSDGEPGAGGGASPGLPRSPHLGSRDPGAHACVCPTPRAADTTRPRRGPRVTPSGTCSPLPSSLPRPRHPSSHSSLASCSLSHTHTHTPGPLRLPCVPHPTLSPPGSGLRPNVIAAPPGCSEKYTTLPQEQLHPYGKCRWFYLHSHVPST